MSAVTRVAALMWFRLAIVVCLALALAGCNREPYSRSSSGFSSLEKRILYDFRSREPGMRADLDAATTRKIFSAIFPTYLSDARQCKAGAEAGQPGQIVPRIHSAAEGSFTAAGLKQIVYLIDVGECGHSVSTRRLAVFTSGALTANVEAPVATEILRTYDLDNDGKNELLLHNGGAGRGAVIATASVVEFEKNSLKTFEEFGQIYDNTCATDAPSKSMSASVVYYLSPPPGQKPRFTVELYRAPCPASGQQPQWTRVSGK